MLSSSSNLPSFAPRRSPPGETPSDNQSSPDISLPSTESPMTDQSGSEHALLPSPDFEIGDGTTGNRTTNQFELSLNSRITTQSYGVDEDDYDDDEEEGEDDEDEDEDGQNPIHHRHHSTRSRSNNQSSSGNNHNLGYSFSNDEIEFETNRDILDDEEGDHRNNHQSIAGHTNEGEDDQDSMIDASEAEVSKRALSILGMDSHGRVLQLSAEDEKATEMIWNRVGPTDLRRSPTSFVSIRKPFEPDSQRAPDWMKRLKNDVLIKEPSTSAEEANLVHSIQQNLRNIVNNLDDDQWLYSTPPAFLPTSNSLTNRANTQAPEPIEEEYLQTEFNPRSLASVIPSTTLEASLFPPRRLWLGEDEDEGADSDVSLVDLLNVTPSRSDNRVQSRWDSASARRTRHGQGSALARQVSRLGMAE